ncbi:N-acetyltransferase family protein [Metarhizium rileyi]|uniref:N-acetyltransferase family protein n=1 Tax=Metarhizium rileyi (strain RCEF 4871) TaxID=1649241 RepID=A0A162JQG7_METRR|nr:N-acetyltransferase family protein [Metarhizium rileyi RCEF 4871]
MAYTPDQLDRYLHRINYPRSKHPRDALQRLTQLVAHQVASVPFESFALHYSQHKTLSLDPEALFEKIVVLGKGGYCMELNAFFAGMMRALGYQVLNAGGRVKTPAGGYTGWQVAPSSHMVNIVTVDNTRYNVDVGFGSHEPMRPIPLLHNYTFTQIAPRQGKLEYRSIAQHTDPSQRAWVYSTREHPSAPWQECNMFVETEFFAADYEAMNLSTMSAGTSFFVQNVVGMRAILDDAAEVAGVYTLLGNRVKRQMRDQDAELVAELETEHDRVRAMEDYFGVRLTALERRGIRGLPTELKGSKAE